MSPLQVCSSRVRNLAQEWAGLLLGSGLIARALFVLSCQCGLAACSLLPPADMEGEGLALLQLLGPAGDEQEQPMPWEREDSVGPSAVVVPGQQAKASP